MKLPFIEIIESITPVPNLLMWKYADEYKTKFAAEQGGDIADDITF